MIKLDFSDVKYKDMHRLAWSIGRLDYRLRESQKLIKEAWEKSKLTSRKFYIESTRRLGKSSFLLHLMVEQ